MRTPMKIDPWLVAVALVLILSVALASPALAKGYWFESYQRAVELIDGERLDEASVLLEDVISEMPTPEASARIPGNRFVNYLPYYQRARIQYLKGDLDGAAHNLAVSEAFGAVRADRRALAGLRELRAGMDSGAVTPVASVALD
jgi:hypothetical protein